MNKQTEILKVMYNKGIVSIDYILENVPFGYYHNGKKHLSEILSRMVNNGKITRVKRGMFEIIFKENQNKLL